MSNPKVPAQTLNEQSAAIESKPVMVVNGGEILIPQTEDAPDATPDATPVPVIPEWLIKLNVARATEDAANVTALDALNAALKVQNKAYVAALTSNDFNHMNADVIAARDGVKLADDAIVSFAKNVELLKLQRSADDATNTARYALAEAIGITPERVSELMALPQAQRDAMKASFQTVFGKPVYYAKAGETGKDVTKKQAAAAGDKKAESDVPRGTTGNPEKVGSKRHDIYADLEAGLTRAELIAKYPTDGNSSKLNGTARTVISDYGWKETAEGHYAIS